MDLKCKYWEETKSIDKIFIKIFQVYHLGTTFVTFEVTYSSPFQEK